MKNTLTMLAMLNAKSSSSPQQQIGEYVYNPRICKSLQTKEMRLDISLLPNSPKRRERLQSRDTSQVIDHIWIGCIGSGAISIAAPLFIATQSEIEARPTWSYINTRLPGLTKKTFGCNSLDSYPRRQGSSGVIVCNTYRSRFQTRLLYSSIPTLCALHMHVDPGFALKKAQQRTARLAVTVLLAHFSIESVSTRSQPREGGHDEVGSRTPW